MSKQSAQPMEVKEEPKQSISDDSKIQAVIEKLEAEVEILKDFRKADSDKINNISEQIGSLRSLFFEKEKKLKKIETEAEKASDLVKAMNPKKVVKGFARYDVRLDKIETKNESLRGMIDEIFSQMKDMRTTIKRFKDSEALVKLNKQVKGEITKIEKISNSVQANLKKMEDLYLNFERKFSNKK